MVGFQLSEQRSLVAYFLLFLILLGVLMMLSDGEVVSEEVEAADLPRHSVSVMLSPGRLYAEVTDEQMGPVTFGGNVTVEKPRGVEDVTVTFHCSCDKGWPSVVSPQTITFEEPGMKRFTLTVIVPPGTPPVLGGATVHAYAKSTIWEGEDHNTAGVMVLQYYQFDLLYDVNRGEGEPGGSVSGEFMVNNTGNGEDTFVVRLEEVPSYVSRVEMDETVTVPPGMRMDVDFILHIKDDVDVPFEGRIDVVTFVVTSKGAEDSGELVLQTFEFGVEIRGLSQDLVENWSTYAGYAAVIAVASVVTFIVIRRRRERKDGLLDLEGT